MEWMSAWWAWKSQLTNLKSQMCGARQWPVVYECNHCQIRRIDVWELTWQTGPERQCRSTRQYIHDNPNRRWTPRVLQGDSQSGEGGPSDTDVVTHKSWYVPLLCVESTKCQRLEAGAVEGGKRSWTLTTNGVGPALAWKMKRRGGGKGTITQPPLYFSITCSCLVRSQIWADTDHCCQMWSV